MNSTKRNGDHHVFARPNPLYPNRQVGLIRGNGCVVRIGRTVLLALMLIVFLIVQLLPSILAMFFYILMA